MFRNTGQLHVTFNTTLEIYSHHTIYKVTQNIQKGNIKSLLFSIIEFNVTSLHSLSINTVEFFILCNSKMVSPVPNDTCVG